MYKFKEKPIKVNFVKTKNRQIITDIPAPKTIKIIDACKKFEPDSMNNQLPVVWDRAEGHSVYDNSGNMWIDFTSGIFVTNIGHSHPKIKKIINETVNKSLLNAYYYPTEERAMFSKLLNEKTGFEKSLFLSTGSEAVESSIKMAIKYTKKNKILSFIQSFHGKTMGSQLVGGKQKEKEWIPVKSHVTHIPFPYPWVLSENNITAETFFQETFENINPNEFAAVITEPYQGWCAAFLPKEYAKKLREWCTINNVLLIIDEVQSGFGRTGKLFAYEHFEIIPDIVICGKGISSSLPVSAVLTNSNIANVCQSLNSTHGGNPVGMAASRVSLEVLFEENLIEESMRKGKLLKNLLDEWKKEMPNNISKIYCKGLLASVFIEYGNNENEVFVDKMIEIAMRKGLLSVRTCSGTLKIGPPLSISDEALIEGIEVLKESLKECLDILE